MPRLKKVLWTLAEHENLPGVVVARMIGLTDQKRKIEAASGVFYADWEIAEAAAEEINDKYAANDGIVADLTNAAHMSGFKTAVRIEGQRLYVPIKAPEGALQQ